MRARRADVERFMKSLKSLKGTKLRNFAVNDAKTFPGCIPKGEEERVFDNLRNMQFIGMGSVGVGGITLSGIKATAKRVEATGAGECHTLAQYVAQKLMEKFSNVSIKIVTWQDPKRLTNAHTYLLFGYESSDLSPRQLEAHAGSYLVIDPWAYALGHGKKTGGVFASGKEYPLHAMGFNGNLTEKFDSQYPEKSIDKNNIELSSTSRSSSSSDSELSSASRSPSTNNCDDEGCESGNQLKQLENNIKVLQSKLEANTHLSNSDTTKVNKFIKSLTNLHGKLTTHLTVGSQARDADTSSAMIVLKATNEMVIDLQKNSKNPKVIFSNYEKQCKKASTTNFWKAVTTVVCAGIGLIVGGVLGFGLGAKIGMCVGWSIGAGLTGVGLGKLSGYLFFKPEPLIKDALGVAKQARLAFK